LKKRQPFVKGDFRHFNYVGGYHRRVATIKKGPTIEATPGWVAMALARIDEKGLNQQKVAKLVGAHKSALSKFFRHAKANGNHASRFVNMLADVLEMPRPSPRGGLFRRGCTNARGRQTRPPKA